MDYELHELSPLYPLQLVPAASWKTALHVARPKLFTICPIACM